MKSVEVAERALVDLCTRDVIQLLDSGEEKQARAVMKMTGMSKTDMDKTVKEHDEMKKQTNVEAKERRMSYEDAVKVYAEHVKQEGYVYEEPSVACSALTECPDNPVGSYCWELSNCNGLLAWVVDRGEKPPVVSTLLGAIRRCTPKEQTEVIEEAVDLVEELLGWTHLDDMIKDLKKMKNPKRDDEEFLGHCIFLRGQALDFLKKHGREEK